MVNVKEKQLSNNTTLPRFSSFFSVEVVFYYLRKRNYMVLRTKLMRWCPPATCNLFMPQIILFSFLLRHAPSVQENEEYDVKKVVKFHSISI